MPDLIIKQRISEKSLLKKKRHFIKEQKVYFKKEA